MKQQINDKIKLIEGVFHRADTVQKQHPSIMYQSVCSFQLPANVTAKALGNVPSAWALATDVGDPNRLQGS